MIQLLLDLVLNDLVVLLQGRMFKNLITDYYLNFNRISLFWDLILSIFIKIKFVSISEYKQTNDIAVGITICKKVNNEYINSSRQMSSTSYFNTN